MKINQGAVQHSMEVRGPDYYPTPLMALETLLQHYDLPPRLWDPCAGRGELSAPLSNAGYRVTATDLHAWPGADPCIIPGVDFLTTPHRPDGLEAVIMNPPFNLIDAFIRYALGLAPTVFVFGRLMHIEGAGRSDYMDAHLIHVLAGIERLPMLHREGYEGKKIPKSGVPFAWFIFGAEASDEPGLSILQRVSWYGTKRRLEPYDGSIERRDQTPVCRPGEGYPPGGRLLAVDGKHS